MYHTGFELFENVRPTLEVTLQWYLLLSETEILLSWNTLYFFKMQHSVQITGHYKQQLLNLIFLKQFRPSVIRLNMVQWYHFIWLSNNKKTHFTILCNISRYFTIYSDKWIPKQQWTTPLVDLLVLLNSDLMLDNLPHLAWNKLYLLIQLFISNGTVSYKCKVENCSVLISSLDIAILHYQG